jgi:hypothetical protein
VSRGEWPLVVGGFLGFFLARSRRRELQQRRERDSIDLYTLKKLAAKALLEKDMSTGGWHRSYYRLPGVQWPGQP